MKETFHTKDELGDVRLPQRKRRVYFAAVAVLLVSAGVGMFLSLTRQPYLMTLTPAGGGCLMQFSQPDRGLVSPVFTVALPVETPRAIGLRSGTIPVPGCAVEFHDTTLLPGRFQLRVGKTLYDVMESRIEVSGKVIRWSPTTLGAVPSPGPWAGARGVRRLVAFAALVALAFLTLLALVVFGLARLAAGECRTLLWWNRDRQIPKPVAPTTCHDAGPLWDGSLDG